MENIYISNIKINKVRHLHDLQIPLSEDGPKNLILTGKNGSGKTSLLRAMTTYLMNATNDNIKMARSICRNDMQLLNQNNYPAVEQMRIQDQMAEYKTKLDIWSGGIALDIVPDPEYLALQYKHGNFIMAYYPADRIFKVEESKTIEVVEPKAVYGIEQYSISEFSKYLSYLKTQTAFIDSPQDQKEADAINAWFVRLEDMMKELLEDDSVHLVFRSKEMKFYIEQDGREPYSFNQLSSGYANVLQIMMDLVMRMQKAKGTSFVFDLPGIVLIDEIETHLHLQLQKTILPMLTAFFPNIQFIVTTHSPFVLNSLQNCIIYDLQNHTLVENGLSEYSYSAVVEGYYGAKEQSDRIAKDFERYKQLIQIEHPSDDEIHEIAMLEITLDEIPDFLDLGFATEYLMLKLDYHAMNKNGEERSDGKN